MEVQPTARRERKRRRFYLGARIGELRTDLTKIRSETKEIASKIAAVGDPTDQALTHLKLRRAYLKTRVAEVKGELAPLVSERKQASAQQEGAAA